MTLDQWLVLLCGLAFLTIPVGLLIADQRTRRRRHKAADDLGTGTGTSR